MSNKLLASIPILLVLLGITELASAQIPQKCKRISPCICEDEFGRFVDLRPLAHSDGTPRYLNVPIEGGDGTTYSFNPCYGFSEGPANSACKDVAVCRSQNGTSEFRDLGDHKSAIFGHFDNGNLSIVYTSKAKNYRTILTLYCSDGPTERTFYVQGYMGDNTTWLQLSTKYACPRNESEIEDFDYDNSMFQTTDEIPLKELDFTTPPAPHVVTMTSRPEPPQETVSLIVLLLLAILVCVTLILAVLVGSVVIRGAKKRLFRDTIMYQPVPTEPQAYYDKGFGIIL